MIQYSTLCTFQVKADVQNVSGELIVSGLDSATSLIQAAKNLMNAVVLTVKSCYVASTKYPRLSVTEKGVDLTKTKPLVVWKMKVSYETGIEGNEQFIGSYDKTNVHFCTIVVKIQLISFYTR